MAQYTQADIRAMVAEMSPPPPVIRRTVVQDTSSLMRRLVAAIGSAINSDQDVLYELLGYAARAGVVNTRGALAALQDIADNISARSQEDSRADTRVMLEVFRSTEALPQGGSTTEAMLARHRAETEKLTRSLSTRSGRGAPPTKPDDVSFESANRARGTALLLLQRVADLLFNTTNLLDQYARAGFSKEVVDQQRKVILDRQARIRRGRRRVVDSDAVVSSVVLDALLSASTEVVDHEAHKIMLNETHVRGFNGPQLVSGRQFPEAVSVATYPAGYAEVVVSASGVDEGIRFPTSAQAAARIGVAPARFYQVETGLWVPSCDGILTSFTSGATHPWLKTYTQTSGVAVTYTIGGVTTTASSVAGVIAGFSIFSGSVTKAGLLKLVFTAPPDAATPIVVSYAYNSIGDLAHRVGGLAVSYYREMASLYGNDVETGNISVASEYTSTADLVAGLGASMHPHGSFFSSDVLGLQLNSDALDVGARVRVGFVSRYSPGILNPDVFGPTWLSPPTDLLSALVPTAGHVLGYGTDALFGAVTTDGPLLSVELGQESLGGSAEVTIVDTSPSAFTLPDELAELAAEDLVMLASDRGEVPYRVVSVLAGVVTLAEEPLRGLPALAAATDASVTVRVRGVRQLVVITEKAPTPSSYLSVTSNLGLYLGLTGSAVSQINSVSLEDAHLKYPVRITDLLYYEGAQVGTVLGLRSGNAIITPTPYSRFEVGVSVYSKSVKGYQTMVVALYPLAAKLSALLESLSTARPRALTEPESQTLADIRAALDGYSFHVTAVGKGLLDYLRGERLTGILAYLSRMELYRIGTSTVLAASTKVEIEDLLEELSLDLNGGAEVLVTVDGDPLFSDYFA